MNTEGNIPERELGHVGSENGRETVFRRGSWAVRHVASTTSTNTVLLDESNAAAVAGSPMRRTALMADYQSAGRGRLDRTWEAPAGANLTVSMLFPDESIEPVALTQAVGVAALNGVERLSPPGEAGAANGHIDGLGLKWPNDVMFDGRKLAGVLAQRSASTGAVVVGIGLNVGWCPDGAASLVDDVELTCTPRQVLDALLDALDELLHPDHVGQLSDIYRSRLLTLGQRVRVELPGGATLTGRAEALADDGRLVVADESPSLRRTLDVGDIVHLRPSPD